MMWRTSSRGMTYETGDGFVVYFDTASGTTHLINELAAWLLAELATCPLSTEQLQERVFEQMERVSVPEVKNLVATLIAELQSADLIEAC